MRYDKFSNPILHKLGKDSSFEEVYLTLFYLGYNIDGNFCNDSKITITKPNPDPQGKFCYDYTTCLDLKDLIPWINHMLIEKGYIREEVEE